MLLRRHFLVPLTVVTAAAAGCGDTEDSLSNGRKVAPGAPGDPPAAVAEKLVAGPAMMRNLSNREFIKAVSDLIGEPLSLELQKTWTATTQFSGFDAVPWTNLDTKAVRDLSDTLETILDKAVASPKVMTCTVASADDLAWDKCAKAIVEPFAKRAYGRPLADAEKAGLMKRYDEAVALAKPALPDPKAVFSDGVRAAIGTVLLSPQFLTRVEPPPSPEFVGERDLTSFELASRVSFMFLGSIPDEELWAKAESDELAKDPEALRVQVERLMDTKTDVFVQSFMGQWFDFRAYANAEAGTLEATMWNESWRVMADIVKENLPITAIVNPGFTYLNQDLAKHYNVVGQFPKELTRVRTNERGGVLQQGSWLSLSATPLKTSAIHRGRLVQDRLLCKVVPPPSSELFEKIQMVSASIPATATVKQRLEQHRQAGEACMGCHQFMDPIGLGLEGFDQHGRLRSAYADGKPVETDSNLLGTPFAKFGQLNDMIAELPDYQKCAAEKLTVYTTRRIVDVKTPSDADLIAYLTHPQGDRPPSVREMILRLVTSKAFRKVTHAQEVK